MSGPAPARTGPAAPTGALSGAPPGPVPEPASEPVLAARLAAILREAPPASAALELLADSGLPDAWLCAGAIYGAVWNRLTGRPPGHGIRDLDLIYFDGADLSWAAEDRAIRALAPRAAALPWAVELRNQARVHLWYPARFGAPYPPLGCATDSLRRYLYRAQAVAVRPGPCGGIEIAAPFGLEDLFALRMLRNDACPDQPARASFAARIAARWPEVAITG